ncbi:hypothetical protein VTK56DRAFT_2258 [Thermocarpiscus australiensis]
MAPATRLCLLLPLRPVVCNLPSRGSQVALAATATTAAAAAVRAIHSNPAQPAKVVPVYGTGPPPEPPQPSAEYAAEERIARRRRQAEMLREAGHIRAGGKQSVGQGSTSIGAKKSSSGLKKRFWKDVHVREVNGALEIHLDTRPLRHPTTKSIIRLPRSKPHLAHALALEWDNLVSAQQATKQHLIPLTSLVSRALDIAADDDAHTSSTDTPPLRASIAQTLLRYLDTDSLLCWSPPPASSDDHDHPNEGGGPSPSLHEKQKSTAAPIVSFLTGHVWPGVQIVPVLEGDSIVPRRQAPETRAVVQGWVLSLTAFELAGLERATLAGKSLLAAARLVAEWSEDAAGVAAIMKQKREKKNDGGLGEEERFGVEEAARAVSLEVDWQTGRWGEVEDTHDVEREDLRRQLGSVVLLVSGSGAAGSKS